MERKTGCCPKCLFENHHNKFFEVNEELDSIICPICEAHIKPAEAIKTFEKFVFQLQRNAESLLFDYCDGFEALEIFASMIDDAYFLAYYNKKNPKDELINYVDPIFIDAFFGRILSIISLSTLRSARIKQAKELLDSEKELFYRVCKADNTKFLIFVKRLIAFLDIYFTKLTQTLKKKETYKTIQACCVMIIRKKDARDLLEKVIEMIDVIGDNTEKEELKDAKNICNEKMIGYDQDIMVGKTYFYGKGQRAVFSSLGEDGFPFFRADVYSGLNQDLIKLTFEEKISKLKEVIFKSRSKPILLYRLSPVILFFSISFVCITAYSVYIFKGVSSTHKWTSMITCAVFLFITFLCLFQTFFTKARIKKRSKNFLFKSALIRYKDK